MPRYAPELECSVEDKASLAALIKRRTAEAHAVERARIILACLEGKEIQQVARELGISLATVSKWRQRFSLWGLRGLRDQLRALCLSPWPAGPSRAPPRAPSRGTGITELFRSRVITGGPRGPVALPAGAHDSSSDAAGKVDPGTSRAATPQ